MRLRDSQKNLFKDLVKAESPEGRPCSIGRLSAHLSFGKTFLMLALVQQHRVPARRKALPLRTDPLMYWIPTRYIPSTLVVATKSVIAHWVDHISTYTPYLNFFVADSARTLKCYEEYLYNGQANVYDIVFVKTGTTKSFIPRWADDSYEEPATTLPTINVMNLITRGLVWARLIIDDYDTIPITPSTTTPPAYFTWLVSATWKARKWRNEKDISPTMDEHLSKKMPDMMLMCGLSSVVPDEMNFQAVAEFVLPSITHKKFTLRPSAIDRALVKGVVSDELREAVHSGSFEKAAQLLGVQFSTPGELVAAVFQDHTTQYKQASVALQVIKDFDWDSVVGARPIPATRANDIVNRIRVDSKTQDAISIIQSVSCITKNYTNSSIMRHAIESLQKEMEDQRDQKLDVLHRLQDNVKIGWCQVCKVPWEDDEAQYIMTCCHIVVCEDCIFDGNQYVKRCPNCAKDVELGRGFVRSKELLNPDDITLMVDKEEKKDFYEKSQALIDFIRGVEFPYLETNTSVMPANGTLPKDCGEIVDRPIDEDRRYLVYTFHRQSRKEICMAFDNAGLDYNCLVGNAKNRRGALKAFKTGPSPQVLVISAAEDCAGLHLFEASHVLLYHAFASESVQNQIIGRAQRNGRKYSLEVVSFLFPDEN